MTASRPLRVIVALDAFVMALGHVPIAMHISASFAEIPLYFLIATIVYVLGGVFVVSGKIFKLANVGLIVLAIIDNLLLIYTRMMPSIFFGRILSWSTGWFPLGTVQIFIGQMIIIVLCAVLLRKNSPVVLHV